jgi:hypothetical protein
MASSEPRSTVSVQSVIDTIQAHLPKAKLCAPTKYSLKHFWSEDDNRDGDHKVTDNGQTLVSPYCLASEIVMVYVLTQSSRCTPMVTTDSVLVQPATRIPSIFWAALYTRHLEKIGDSFPDVPHLLDRPIHLPRRRSSRLDQGSMN